MKTSKSKQLSSLHESKAIKLISKSFNNPEKVLALCLEQDLSTDDLDLIIENGNIFEINNEEYLIVTDEEGDDLWDEYLDSYIDNCVISELPEIYIRYFDSEKFKEDCRVDGRANSLSTYDGNEAEQEVNGATYYIYRTN